jgi:iron(III) transport system ATP-binding protein
MNFIAGEVTEVLQDRDALSIRTGFSDRMLCRAGTNATVAPGQKVYASIRPEDIEIVSEPPLTEENVFLGKIAHKAYLGNILFLFVNMDDTMIRVQVPHDMPQEESDAIHLLLDPEKCLVLS